MKGFSIRSDRLVTLYLARPLKRILPGNPGKALPILMYHSISERPGGSRHPYYETRTSPRAFDEQMKFLRDNGYSSAGIGDIPTIFREGNGAGRTVIITFDDGYRDFLDRAFPILEKYGFGATVFLVTGFMRNGCGTFDGEEILCWADVRELRKQGIVFGSHSVNHPGLGKLTLEELEAEIADSKKEMEARLGETVEAFSCPYAFPEGDADFLGKYFGILERCGYRAGVTTVIGRVREGDNPLALRRIPVNDHDDTILFRSKLMGAYDWVHVPQYLRKKCSGWLVA